MPRLVASIATRQEASDSCNCPTVNWTCESVVAATPKRRCVPGRLGSASAIASDFRRAVRSSATSWRSSPAQQQQETAALVQNPEGRRQVVLPVRRRFCLGLLHHRFWPDARNAASTGWQPMTADDELILNPIARRLQPRPDTASRIHRCAPSSTE